MRHKLILLTVFLVFACGLSVFGMKYARKFWRHHRSALTKHKPTQDELIKSVVKSHMNQIVACYNQRIRDGLNKVGNLKIAWDIDEQGNPLNFQEKENQLNDAELYDCSSQAISEWQFPRGIYYKVDYTFHLKQKNKKIDMDRDIASKRESEPMADVD